MLAHKQELWEHSVTRQRKTISRMKGIKSVKNYWKFMEDK